jgi:hypothetical protein
MLHVALQGERTSADGSLTAACCMWRIKVSERFKVSELPDLRKGPCGLDEGGD